MTYPAVLFSIEMQDIEFCILNFYELYLGYALAIDVTARDLQSVAKVRRAL